MLSYFGPQGLGLKKMPQQSSCLHIRFLGCQYYRAYIRAQAQLPIVLVTGLLGMVDGEPRQ